MKCKSTYCECNGAARVACDGRLTHAEMRALYADPVPPAGGEVEVLGYQVTRFTPTGVARLDRPLLSKVLDGWEPAFKVAELVDRAHVTRLQAEVERLKQVAIDRKDELTKLCTERNDLQSELTKARELLEEARQELLHEERFAIAHSIMTFLSKKVG